MYDKSVDKKWQDVWEQQKAWTAFEDEAKKKYYVLEMFPYPSGHLHMGHLRNYSIGDAIARFKMRQGYNVLHPMGWDAFGLPAENAAIEKGAHPRDWTLNNIKYMKNQCKPIGLTYDWDREIATCDVRYYKHQQKIFLDFYKNNLVYQQESVVNWDPVDQTVLANEQVENGRGWRSGALIEKKRLKQWFIKITDFAEELLEGLKLLEHWPDKVKLMQSNWIGKSVGANVKFKVFLPNSAHDAYVEVYTTRPDTLFGAAFIGVSPYHSILNGVNIDGLDDFKKESDAISQTQQLLDTAKRRGVFSGLYALHPFDESIKVPIFVVNFVVMDYGSGAIFGCPAHDERDHEIAIEYNLPITQVVYPIVEADECDVLKKAYTGDGILKNSGFLDGLTVDEGKKAAILMLEKLGMGSQKVNYKLRDWGISRQRYWGCPIPMIHCETCGTLPVLDEHLPIELPDDISFEKPGNPLDHHPTWKHTNCHKCGGRATRETDTMDTFMDSSWYFARYCNNKSDDAIDFKAAKYWLEVDQYIGGIEHAVLHLLYARFFTKALKKCGYLDIDEPFSRLLTQGMVNHETYKDSNNKWVQASDVRRDGQAAYHIITGEQLVIGRVEKMSKSKKNVIDPDKIINEYGADTARLFVLSDSPVDKDLQWTDAGIQGCVKFLNKLFKQLSFDEFFENSDESLDLSMKKQINKAIKDVTYDMEKFHFNKAIARIRELSNSISEINCSYGVKKDAMKAVASLLNPIAPHATEELWSLLEPKGKMMAMTPWPSYDESLLKDDEVTIAIQVAGKMRGTVMVSAGADKDEVLSAAMNEPSIAKYLIDQKVTKLIFIQDKVLNIIAKQLS